MNQLKKQAFTLVELIVVITILAILGTIAFISLQGYSKDARDATRVSDLTNIIKSLELYGLQVGKYPIPTNPVDVTYSGSIVWEQGTLGESAITNLQRLNKLPLDPNFNNEYTYSLLNTGKQYQLAGAVEGELTYNPLITQANASNLRALVKGNYNELLTKTDLVDPNTCRVISLPSIILSDTETTTELTDVQMGSGKLVYNGKNNLPDSYKSITKEERSNNFTFRDYNTEKDTLELTSSGCAINEANIDNVIYKLSESFNGTELVNESIYNNIVNTPTGLNTKKEIVRIVNNNIRGELEPISTEIEKGCEGNVYRRPLIGSTYSGAPVWGDRIFIGDFDLSNGDNLVLGETTYTCKYGKLVLSSIIEDSTVASDPHFGDVVLLMNMNDGSISSIVNDSPYYNLKYCSSYDWNFDEDVYFEGNLYKVHCSAATNPLDAPRVSVNNCTNKSQHQTYSASCTPSGYFPSAYEQSVLKNQDDIGNNFTNATPDTHLYYTGATSVFGGYSLYSNTTLIAEDNDKYTLDGDFTIETFVNFNSITSAKIFYYYGPFQFYYDTNNKISIYSGGAPDSGYIINPTNNLGIGQWHHIAFTRESNIYKLFINGVQEAQTYTSSGGPVNPGVNSLKTGGFGGYLDGIRVTNGVARYTSNFTPPSEVYPTQ